MADNLTAPAAGAVLATKDIGGVQHPKTLIADFAGADALGAVGANPAANTILGRLKALVDAILAGFGVTAPADSFAVIAPSDNALSAVPKAVFVGTAGNLVVKGADGVQVSFAVEAGALVPIRPRYVMAATSAGGIIGLY